MLPNGMMSPLVTPGVPIYNDPNGVPQDLAMFLHLLLGGNATRGQTSPYPLQQPSGIIPFGGFK